MPREPQHAGQQDDERPVGIRPGATQRRAQCGFGAVHRAEVALHAAEVRCGEPVVGLQRHGARKRGFRLVEPILRAQRVAEIVPSPRMRGIEADGLLERRGRALGVAAFAQQYPQVVLRLDELRIER